MVRSGTSLWCYIIIMMLTTSHKSFMAIRSSAEPAGGYPGRLRRLLWKVSVLSLQGDGLWSRARCSVTSHCSFDAARHR